MKKKRNYLYAALVFIALMGLMNGLGIFWSVAAMLEGALIGGEQGTEAVYLQRRYKNKSRTGRYIIIE